MLSDLYSRMKEVSKELNISYSDWAKKANIKPMTLYMFRNNIAKGKEARYSTLENLANSIERLPFLFIDNKLEKAVKLGDRFISLHSGYETAHYLNEQGRLNQTPNIHAYGEVSDRCAEAETNELVRNLKRLRPDLQVAVDFDKKLCPDTLDGKFD